MKNRFLKRIICTMAACALLICLTVCSFISESLATDHPEGVKLLDIAQLHNGDAKFYGDNQIVTSIDGKLTLISEDESVKRTSFDINANWLSVWNDEHMIVYCNAENQTGIVVLDDSDAVISNTVIMQTDYLQIDPTILKVEDTYYITLTGITGNVNNAEPNAANGEYTIRLYSSDDLLNWVEVSEIISRENNLEDVDLLFDGERFWLIYEKETVDKGDSGVYAVSSVDETGTAFYEEEIELLPQDCDHEPALIAANETGGGYTLYYSCDKDAPGESYNGGNLYYAEYDKDFHLQKKDICIGKATDKGALLYDVNQSGEDSFFLYAGDYLTDCDLIVQKGGCE